ncbi:multidrug efflux RND transporter permease subunit [Burkholderia cepacia]|uniref:multidrug efflux RND transporter permease subunit n=1 Tax=Burkholderia cepacia TaxID=292 RepID=UPI001CF5D985|nr:multidrug efflux RND transporter permease subunit [Burkholderia cepacia]MCA8354599.1 multidrug efflux RND transporter permease subunit [Burkholderia cepacia]
MAEFFIRRPVFAWVIALFIILAGLIAIPQLPVARYPSVAPPSVTITANYPGATPQTMNDGVLSLIERELSGVKNLLYFESSADTSGQAEITVTFKPGTDPALAQVDVQNKIKSVEPRLPAAVRQNGLIVQSASTGFLMIVSLRSDNGRFDEGALADYMARSVSEELRRIDGVGRVLQFGSERAMRIWVDPQKLINFGLSMSDLTTAIGQQNVQIAPGSLGALPALKGQRVTVPLTAQGQLTTPEEFAKVVLRANVDGSKVVLGDVARVELGSQNYTFVSRENNKPATLAGVQLAPGANAVKTAEAIRARMAELSKSMPSGMTYSIPLDTSPFVKISIEKVLHTLLEAMVLVFLVMYLFLQNVRYTLIPAIVAPVAMLGTFAVMLLTGFSINVLTMFGMVLAIGIIVDDAIVVVENVERLMAEEGLSPKDATSKAMKEITGAIIGVTLVLTAVFLPMAMASGSVGVIYKQFTMSMAVSILFSALLALTLTPALCATMLKPVEPGHHEKRGFFGWFNRRFDRLTKWYETRVGRLVGRTGRVMLVFVAISGALVFGFRGLPSSFLPDEDQGYFITSFLMPADSTAERTHDVVKTLEKHLASRPAIRSSISVIGYGFSGQGPNAAINWSVMKDWKDRGDASTLEEGMRAQQAMAGVTEGAVMSLLPPAIDELGNSSGFAMRLEDRANQGTAALKAAEAKLLELAAQSKVVTGVYPDSLPAGTSIRLEIDRAKAQALGVSFTTISDTLSTAMGSTYVNDFPNAGRMQQVIIQADAPARMQIDKVMKLYMRNAAGGMVPLSEVVRPVWTETPLQMVRFKGYPSARISGTAAPGQSSGAAMAEMERLAAQLPPGFAVEWTGQSLQERQSASEAPMLMVLSMIVVFLVLAALYESWSIPLSVMLVVPLGLIGALGAVMLRGLPNDVFFKVGMITVIGLSAKNAILIVEFAKQLREEGKGLIEAAVQASKLRLRPILMTSLAFGLGVVPLVIASGASSETQHAIGTGVLGGMITATVLAIFFVPVFYVFVMSIQERISAWRASGKKPATVTHEHEG